MPKTTFGRRPPTLIEFNREILCGEAGSLATAYGAALAAARLGASPVVISATAVLATLLGGTLFWLAARITHQRAGRRWSLRRLLSDIGFFTPASLTFGLGVYEPVLFFASRHLLTHGMPAALAVPCAQLAAFGLFLASMNTYRVVLAKTVGKQL